MNWFGRDWGAPVCKHGKQIPVPVGSVCFGCDAPILADTSGVSMPFMGETGEGVANYHVGCLLETLGLCPRTPEEEH